MPYSPIETEESTFDAEVEDDAATEDNALMIVAEECFGTRGSYPHPKIRRSVATWFEENGASFENTDEAQLHLEKWISSNFPKDRAEDIITFFDEALEQRRGGQ
jgi:hypothetical protein